MQVQSNSDFISQIEAETERQLTEVISVFQNLSESLLLQPAADGGWSIAECMAHLNTYADFYLPRLTKAIEQAQPLAASSHFNHSFIGQYFINMMDPGRGRRKYKAMKKHQPIEVCSPHIIISKFIQYLENMVILVDKARGKNLMRKSVATSLSSWIRINSGDALWFILIHNRRHIEQARRNLKV